MKRFIHFSITLTLLLLFSQFTFSQAVIDNALKDAFKDNVTKLEVVVTFESEGAPTAQDVASLKNAGIINGLTFRALPIAGVLATYPQVEELAKTPGVRSLYLNKKLEYFNYDSRSLTGVDRLRSDPVMTARNGGLPVSGKGISVLVNDSGIDGTHPDLEYGTHLVQNVMGTTNLNAYDDILPVSYVEGIPNTDELGGHGTHCAGIVAGTGAKSNGKYAGVAPGADLVGYGSGVTLVILDAIGGFDYALTHQFQYGIRVISNSWGSSGNFDPDNPVNVATYAAYKRGMTVVFAAGNSGPSEYTLNPYAAPWVISVAAGDKYGQLVDFSSRGVKDQKETFTYNGETYTFENRPTVTAPGNQVVSTRTIAPVAFLEAPEDTSLEPEYIPFYTHLSGTSMACPHVAGIVALMLEANKSLSPDEVKEILQTTATNMPGREPWEAGAGYVNAYAAVDYAFREAGYGSILNMNRTFNANLVQNISRTSFIIDFNPVISLSSDNNSWTFEVPEGLDVLEGIAHARGIEGDEGNPVDLLLVAPDGTEYESGIYVVFPVYQDRYVSVLNPMPGTWHVKIVGLASFSPLVTAPAIPEQISGYVKFTKFLGYSGMDDIAGNPAEVSIKLAVSEHLMDGDKTNKFRPEDYLQRIEVADYLTMGNAIRQYLPANGISNYSDISYDNSLLVESVTAKGAALRDRFQGDNGVMIPSAPGKFNPKGKVNRTDLCYSMIQSLGLQEEAFALNGKQVKAYYKGESIPVDDAGQIPQGMEGYVQLAINLNLINVYFSLQQGPYDLTPTLHAKFNPLKNITRADYAVIVTRTFDKWHSPDLSLGKSNNQLESMVSQPLTYGLNQNYPNPFNPSTVIKYSIPAAGLVTLDVYNVLGQKVATLVNGVKPAGVYSVTFDASKLASGIYIYRINANDYVKTMKMALMK